MYLIDNPSIPVMKDIKHYKCEEISKTSNSYILYINIPVIHKTRNIKPTVSTISTYLLPENASTRATDEENQKLAGVLWYQMSKSSN